MGVRRVLSVLPRVLDIAEEATADAFLLALQTWPHTGIPESVEAWLLTVARRRAVDRVLTDDDLRLAVLCCHPALNTEAQVVLTLRLSCGATTSAIAAGFLVSDATTAARLTWAKKRIAGSGVEVEMPDDASVDDRMRAVRRPVQLAYAVGHTAANGADLRDDELA